MPDFDPDKYLAPWEVDGEGKPLDEPAEIDPAKLKKYLIGVLGDKVKAQDRAADLEGQVTQATDKLTELQRQNENEEQRRQREDAEREARYADMDKRDLERRKREALEEAFPDATAARLKRLAKRVTGDEKDWVNDAKELVEDGFILSEAKQAQESGDEELVEPEDVDLNSRPRPRRSNGKPATEASSGKPKDVAAELDAAGIGGSGW